MFDFTNYTYSGLLSLVAGIFGISYPLILDAISNIDEKYRATILTKYFLQETRYVVFKWLLVINLVIAVIAPFLLSSFDTPHAVLVSQTAAVILLILSSFLLYELILEYQQPDKLFGLLSYNKPNPTNQNNSQTHINELNELCIFLSTSEDEELFWECWSDVSRYVMSKLDKLGDDKPFPEDITKILKKYRRIVGGSSDECKGSRVYKYNQITPLLYPSFQKSCQHIGKHKIIWAFINDAVNGNNGSWIVQHWSWMDQYYRSQFEYKTLDQRSNKDADMVLMTHVMLGGLLVFKRKYDILNDVLFYSNVLPPKCCLIPSSLAEIADRIKALDASRNNFLSIENSFYFSDLNHGVQNDSAICNEAMKYIGLCVIRLWSIQPLDYNHPLTIPVIPDGYGDVESMIQSVNQLKRYTNLWFNYDVFNLVKNLTLVDKQEVIGKLDEWLSMLESEKRFKEKHPEAEKDKITQFCNELTEASRLLHALPTASDSGITAGDKVSKESFMELIHSNIDVKLFDPSFNICYINMPDTYIQHMVSQTITRYLKHLQDGVVKHYRVQYKDIFRALNQLDITPESHYILDAGIYLGNYEDIYGKVSDFDNDQCAYKSTRIHIINSQENSIYIIPKYCLPYVEYCKISDSVGMYEISNTESLYSNINSVTQPGFNQSEFLFTLARGVSITYLRDGFKCVRLDITYDTSNGELDINRVSW